MNRGIDDLVGSARITETDTAHPRVVAEAIFESCGPGHIEGRERGCVQRRARPRANDDFRSAGAGQKDREHEPRTEAVKGRRPFRPRGRSKHPRLQKVLLAFSRNESTRLASARFVRRVGRHSRQACKLGLCLLRPTEGAERLHARGGALLDQDAGRESSLMLRKRHQRRRRAMGVQFGAGARKNRNFLRQIVYRMGREDGLLACLGWWRNGGDLHGWIVDWRRRCG